MGIQKKSHVSPDMHYHVIQPLIPLQLKDFYPLTKTWRRGEVFVNKVKPHCVLMHGST